MTTDLDVSIDEIKKIIEFLGYGRPTASVWFIGIEEGLGNMDENDALGNLMARAKFDSVMDLYQAHLRLRENDAPIDFERKIPSTQVWKFMAKIMRAREGCQDWADKNEANEYIRARLGRSDGDTFMTELSPIPASRNADKRWIEMFGRKDPGLASGIGLRREKLRQLLRDSAPRLVVCYGRTMCEDFARLLGIEWEPINGRLSRSADSRCLLLPFFGQGQMSHLVIEDLLQAGLLR